MKMAKYEFSKKELKEKRAIDFAEGDIVVCGKYHIFVKYVNREGYKFTHPLCSYVETDAFKILGCTPGVRGGRPYFIDSFLGRGI